MEKSPGLVRRG